METEENVGYQDAMRQVSRSIARRIKTLEDELKAAENHKEEQVVLTARLDELHHVMHTLESLHR